jgi:hypothetical protein
MITATVTRDSNGDFVPSWARDFVKYLKSDDIYLVTLESLKGIANLDADSPNVSPKRELRSIDSEEDFVAALIESHGHFAVSID